MPLTTIPNCDQVLTSFDDVAAAADSIQSDEPVPDSSFEKQPHLVGLRILGCLENRLR
jgi:hypothetical protein